MLDINEIKSIIPHRYPFLLIDKVISIEPQKKITAIKNVSVNEPFFQGHFPEKPIMPGVLIVEAMAQACAVAVKYKNEEAVGLGVFASIDNCKFKKMVEPGDQLQLECEITRLRTTLGKATCTATVNGELACKADISFFIVAE